MNTGTQRALTADDAAIILNMERLALERWGNGDPDGFLEICDPDVVYFDPFTERRVDGIGALRDLYEGLRGKVHIDSYEIVNPRVELCGDMAVLTFNFVSCGPEGEWRWNTTEVYRRRERAWRIIHTHWSLTQPKLA